jgi:hypothetical protein
MKPHRMDGVSLSFGVIFLAIVVFWAFARVVTVDLPAMGWIVASALLLFGVLGVLGALRSGREKQLAPVQAEAVVERPEGVTPQMHAQIMQELMDGAPARLPDEPPVTRRHGGD